MKFCQSNFLSKRNMVFKQNAMEALSKTHKTQPNVEAKRSDGLEAKRNQMLKQNAVMVLKQNAVVMRQKAVVLRQNAIQQSYHMIMSRAGLDNCLLASGFCKTKFSLQGNEFEVSSTRFMCYTATSNKVDFVVFGKLPAINGFDVFTMGRLLWASQCFIVVTRSIDNLIVFSKLSAINGFEFSLPVVVCSGVANALVQYYGALITIQFLVNCQPLTDLRSLYQSHLLWTSQSLCLLSMVN
ncbi:hypothetical protein Tco_1035795 [Tanacetum coccineum]